MNEQRLLRLAGGIMRGEGHNPIHDPDAGIAALFWVVVILAGYGVYYLLFGG